jgi:hypothetical protein
VLAARLFASLARERMLRAPMNRFLPACILLLAGTAFFSPARAQDSFQGVDLLYPEFAHPQEDALAAIKARDYRFVTTDRAGTVPGAERYPRQVEIYGTKVIRQRLRIFVTRSQNFSFNLRARNYATAYNRTLLQYLLKQKAKE